MSKLRTYKPAIWEKPFANNVREFLIDLVFKKKTGVFISSKKIRRFIEEQGIPHNRPSITIFFGNLLSDLHNKGYLKCLRLKPAKYLLTKAGISYFKALLTDMYDA